MSGSAMQARPRIGYVGLGLMGGPMAARLVARGYPVRAFDILDARLQAAVGAGARAATSPADAARDADLVLLNLPTTDAVEQAVFGPDGVAGVLRADARTQEAAQGLGHHFLYYFLKTFFVSSLILIPAYMALLC